VHEWEAKERERELFPHHISQSTHDLLIHVGILKFYQESTSMRGNSLLLQWFIRHWDHGQHGFRVNLDMWYHPTREDIDFIIKLFRRGEDLPRFPELPLGVAREIQLAYV
jgi:hypothetical protein